MTKEQIQQIVDKQRQFFATGATLPISYRMDALKKLEVSVKNHESELVDALKMDLGKSEQESFMCEHGLSLAELSHMKKHLKKYARNRHAATPLTNFAASSYVKTVPYGTALIMSPWNYPVLLTLGPLVDAIAAGNTAVVKPSAYSPNCSRVLADIIRDAFDPEYVACVEGGRDENEHLLDEKYDIVFFTGSQAVGRIVMEKASCNLTPVILELGGKSPCIVDKSCNIKLAAKRIVWGKYLNCGQTCVAPDYVLAHESVKDELCNEIKKEIAKQFGDAPLSNEHYGKIINEKHFDRLLSLIDEEKVICGGKSDRDTLRIEPTVMDNVTFDDAVMQMEIFGPIMPVITFSSIGEVIRKINAMPSPLALYIFSSSKEVQKKVTGECVFGGGCINDTVIHLACSSLGFGGVGESGMGAYHGKTGFDAFSHHKSIVDKKTWIDLFIRYQPFSALKLALIKMFLR